MYSADDLLMLSGIQHIAFCPRQWALIHIEQRWAENRLTVEGHHLHEKVDDPFVTDSRKNVVTCRSLAIVSFELGLYGKADVVEFYANDSSVNAIEIYGKQGYWRPIPVEYKRGKPKSDPIDEAQLCAQAMCLEEMYNVNISEGFLYYGETRHRHRVVFSHDLRTIVKGLSSEMHAFFDKRLTPLPDFRPRCKSCSLVNECLPRPFSRRNSVSNYLKQLEE